MNNRDIQSLTLPLQMGDLTTGAWEGLGSEEDMISFLSDAVGIPPTSIVKATETRINS